jgi:murein L,D-transpeptidase YafK
MLRLLFLTILVGATARADFAADQKRFPRVRGAFEHFDKKVRALFQEKGVPFPPTGIFLRAFKRDRALELWARGSDGGKYTLVKTFKICALSGDLGPKRREGDGQIPEGFYHISTFNPTSDYHLSLQVAYPNGSDRILGAGHPLGGSIFIHGNCVTIGCLPLRDEGIEELYVVAVATKVASRDPIPVHIFPAKLTENTMRDLALEYASRPKLLAFWKNLKEGYDLFERERKVPSVEIGRDGSYRFSSTTSAAAGSSR